MDSFLLKTKSSLEECESHLKITNTLQTNIESYLVRYLAVTFCAEMEETVRRLFNESVENRANQYSDSELKEFIANQLKKLKSSSLKKGDLADYLKTFSEQAKEKFNIQLDSRDAEIEGYSNIITNRHTIAHTSKNIEISLIELKKTVEFSDVILNAMLKSLQPELNNSDE